MKLLSLVEELAAIGISTTISSEDGELIGAVSGFSKSGEVKLYQRCGFIECVARYNESSEVRRVDDLIEIAWDWFIRYKDRTPFENPTPQWAEVFEQRGWIFQEVVKVVKIIRN